MKIVKSIFIGCMIFTLAGCGSQDVTINLDEQYQTIEGFGASGAWWAQDIGGWSDENRNKITELLFDLDNGIGLTVYRYNIGAGSGNEINDAWRNTNSIESTSGEYNIDNDKAAIWVLRRAIDLGVETVVAFANSAPARLTQSGYVSGGVDGETNLTPENYEGFANYLIDVVLEMRSEGINVDYVSPINEPQWDWNPDKGQEGSHFSIEECVAFLEVFNEVINERGVDISISAIEAGEWKDAIDYADAILSNNGFMDELDHFAGHSYWSKTRHKNSFISDYNESYNKPIWVSEWTEMKSGRDVTMDTALTLASVISEDLTILSATSWQYWIAVSKYDWRDGLIYTNEDTEDIIETKRLYVMGNFSKFIRPGYVRVGVDSSSKVDISAYISETEDELVVVGVNTKNKSVTENLVIDDKYETMSIYVTDKDNDLELVYEGNISSFEFTPESVTTIIYR